MSGCKALSQIVFLHGAGVDHALWEPQISAFAAEADIFAPDLPGHGSAAPVGTVEEMADAVHDALMEAGLQRYAVVGLSLGGMVALDMARHWPDEVTHLVMLESVPTVTRHRMVRSLGYWMLGLLALINPRWFTLLPARAMGAETEAAGVYLKDAMSRMSARNVRDVMRAALAFDGRAGLGAISMPTLVMVGAENRAMHRRAKEMADAIPGCRFEIVANAGHILNRDASETVNAAIRAHLGLTGQPRAD